MGLDFVELVMAFEEAFNISIPDKDASELTTPRKVADYVMNKIGDRGVSRSHVEAKIRQIIEDQTGISDFSDDDHFVDDMQLD